MKLSIAVTTFNRSHMTVKAFEQVLNDDRVTEIVIVDDCSDPGEYAKLSELVAGMPKVKLNWNHQNIGMSRNKARAIEACSNEWVMILDSDNVIDSSYFDALEKVELRKDIIFCPEFARPNFSFLELAGMTFDRYNAGEHIGQRAFEVLLNTSNNVVHRESYGRVYRYNDRIKEADTIWFNYLWLVNGGSLHVVPGMQYDHLVHKDSGWLSNAAENTRKANELKALIKSL